jgi:uncharacterized protein YeaO (DUF488 family)
MPVRVRRVYDEPDPADGARVLVDRIWPRGLAKDRAHLEEWCKAVAPSDGLRKWYGHDPDRFEEFPERAAALAHLRTLAAERPLTLLTATRQSQASQAAVLAEVLERDR